MADVAVKRSVRVEEKTTVTFTEEQAAAILRVAAGAPETAKVEFECGYEGFLREIHVEWSVIEDKEL